jgi:hypothetical protein
MAARVCKDIIRALLREKTKELRVPSSEPYRQLVLHLFNLFSGYSASSDRFWNSTQLPDFSRIACRHSGLSSSQLARLGGDIYEAPLRNDRSDQQQHNNNNHYHNDIVSNSQSNSSNHHRQPSIKKNDYAGLVAPGQGKSSDQTVAEEELTEQDEGDTLYRYDKAGYEPLPSSIEPKSESSSNAGSSASRGLPFSQESKLKASNGYVEDETMEDDEGELGLLGSVEYYIHQAFEARKTKLSCPLCQAELDLHSTSRGASELLTTR